ncbi:calcium/potassium channel (CAKC), putative [Trypanosoma cruzi]|uniref:Calcium/potassium channel (CAKC), putative n=1 Tax=Trypanosoma cruzi (strain CL Brener) TaxID=353153 RepID=Q4E0F3_TRYCC|nr:calcium/potassium channel (CAKC), putative [Trypanosoma cruzi]EAN98275.1 calcium/potassium channel (CAKC), putative [Trypanosoma cruzi]|eukprot:XP_820126.1 calcium/potassium channel (CAKC) [Trypanosoma cruzi strain CL Brener]
MFEPRSQMAYRQDTFRNIRSLRKLFEVMDQKYSSISITFLIIHLIMELASVVFYVWTAVVSEATSVSEFHWNGTMFNIEFGLNIVFFLEWVALFFGEDDKIGYCLSWLSIVNAMTSIPMIVIGIGGLTETSWRSYWVPMYLRVWWLRDCVVVLLDYPQVERWMKDVTREVCRFVATLFAGLCTCAGTLQIVESTTGSYMNPFNAFYCMVVTFSTIGYGDIVPGSTPSRLLMAVFIVFAVSHFMPLFQRLVSISRQRLHYNVYNSRGGRKAHVILAGIFTKLGVKIILQDFYGGWRRYVDLRIVLLSPVEHPLEVKLLVNLPWFKDRVLLMIGDPQKESDLKRADARHADAIFLFGDTFPATFHTDYTLIQQSLSINNHDSELAQYLYLRSERNTKHVASYAAGVVEGERLLHHLLGLGVVVPGAIPLIVNLLRTYDPFTLDMKRTLHWVEQYELSLQHNIFCIDVPDAYRGRDFHRLARLFFDHDVTLIGVITTGGMVQLNPSRVATLVGKIIFIAKSPEEVKNAMTEVEETRFSTIDPEADDQPCYPTLVLSNERNGSTSWAGEFSGHFGSIQQINDAYDFENHFVVIDLSIANDRAAETEGAHEGTLTSAAVNIFHIMQSIRQSYPQNDIVLLTKDTSFSVYFDRYWHGVKGAIPIKYVDGCGLNTNDLRRCNLKQSAGIVIFVFGDTSGKSTSGVSMLVNLSIASILPSSHNIPVVVELDSLQHLSLFPPYAEHSRLRQKAEVDFVFEPNYIIGNAISRHMLFPLVHATYFMPEFIDIIDMIVSGVDEETPSLGRLSLSLSHEVIETYKDVVDYCLSLRYLPIGLHICISDTRNLSLNGKRFVMTNPPKDLPVDREKDGVFYLLPT